MSKPFAVSDAEFEKTVLQSEVPVIVDFWAPWCTPCKMITPMLENIAQEYDGKLIVAKRYSNIAFHLERQGGGSASGCGARECLEEQNRGVASNCTSINKETKTRNPEY